MSPPIQFKKAFPSCVLLLLVMCAIPVALAQRNANKQSVAKLDSMSKGLAAMGNLLPTNIIVVTNTNDSGPGSLRDALAAANDGDMIDATGVSGTILLTSGELQVTHNVTINGPGAANLAVNGNDAFAVFHNFASNATISGFTITNGNGGGVVNRGGLTVSDSGVVSNVGGGIVNEAMNRATTVTITNSTISDNSATNGGGIFNQGLGGDVALTVSNSTISGNSATSNGGGIFSEAAGLEAGASSTVTVGNSTLSDNSAGVAGGAIYNGEATHGRASLFVKNTVLNAGASGGTIFNNLGTVTSLGFNLASDNGGGVLTGHGDRINTDPMLGPLQDNGGPTFTHELLNGSPAIDAGDAGFTPPPFYDQRGPDFFRVRNGRIDIGSFEVQAGSTPTPTPTGTPTLTPTPAPRPTPIPRFRPTPEPRP